MQTQHLPNQGWAQINLLGFKSNHRLWNRRQIKSNQITAAEIIVKSNQIRSNQIMIWLENQIKIRHNFIPDPKIIKIRLDHNFRYKDLFLVIPAPFDSSRRDLFNGPGIMKTRVLYQKLWPWFVRLIFTPSWFDLIWASKSNHADQLHSNQITAFEIVVKSNQITAFSNHRQINSNQIKSWFDLCPALKGERVALWVETWKYKSTSVRLKG